MANTGPGLSADDMGRLRQVLGTGAAFAEARIAASELSPVTRAAFISDLAAAIAAGDSGLCAVWAGLAAAAGAAKHEAALGKQGGASGCAGVCEARGT